MIPLMKYFQAGDKITYCDSTLEIREGPFICSSQTAQLDAQKIISSLLNTEDDLRQFCLDYKLQIGNFCRYVIYRMSLIFQNIVHLPMTFSVWQLKLTSIFALYKTENLIIPAMDFRVPIFENENSKQIKWNSKMENILVSKTPNPTKPTENLKKTLIQSPSQLVIMMKLAICKIIYRKFSRR